MPLPFSSGELKIAEVTSRFMDVEEFASLISSIGFRLKSKVRLMVKRITRAHDFSRMIAIPISRFLISRRLPGRRRVRKSGTNYYHAAAYSSHVNISVAEVYGEPFFLSINAFRVQ